MLINLLTSLRRTAGLNPNHTQCRGELTVGGWLSYKQSDCSIEV